MNPLFHFLSGQWIVTSSDTPPARQNSNDELCVYLNILFKPQTRALERFEVEQVETWTKGCEKGRPNFAKFCVD
ncbi:Isopentenyl-diphosphate delta-isomerase [Frankliniella fusca]|uniref:Isopentenyl-diphosphate delta-isomerase n=1 Tax=Frankliniella fusca TaxID=407009 RepID=A0AAE1LTE0_9NEOP|nr:Isopentenyl-diphosphate delta-isomerase [Frankliniella fusca]